MYIDVIKFAKWYCFMMMQINNFEKYSDDELLEMYKEQNKWTEIITGVNAQTLGGLL